MSNKLNELKKAERDLQLIPLYYAKYDLQFLLANEKSAKHAKLMKNVWDFGYITYERERTFNLYSKIEDHANDVHDFLKYLKFGYGRATDDASMEIRHGRMTREDGIEMVKRYDAREPSTLQSYCDFLGISKQQFYEWVEPMRDQSIWEKSTDGNWQPKDAVFLHSIGVQEERARVVMVQAEKITFSDSNKRMYFNPDNPPEKTGDMALDQPSPVFKVI